MRLEGSNWIRGSILLCGLLAFLLVLGAGSDIHHPWAGPNAVLAGDPEGGEGTPTEVPPPPDTTSTTETTSTTGTLSTTGQEVKTVDQAGERDTLVAFFVDVVDALVGLWR